jgi:hypothetical protein
MDLSPDVHRHLRDAPCDRDDVLLDGADAEASPDANLAVDVIEALADFGTRELEFAPLVVIAGVVFFGWRERASARARFGVPLARRR